MVHINNYLNKRTSKNCLNSKNDILNIERPDLNDIVPKL